MNRNPYRILYYTYQRWCDRPLYGTLLNDYVWNYIYIYICSCVADIVAIAANAAAAAASVWWRRRRRWCWNILSAWLSNYQPLIVHSTVPASTSRIGKRQIRRLCRHVRLSKRALYLRCIAELISALQVFHLIGHGARVNITTVVVDAAELDAHLDALGEHIVFPRCHIAMAVPSDVRAQSYILWGLKGGSAGVVGEEEQRKLPCELILSSESPYGGFAFATSNKVYKTTQ